MTVSALPAIAFRALFALQKICKANRYTYFAYQHILAFLVTRSGYFDREYYCGANPDVAKGRHRAALHYIRHGEREGRAPMPLFDGTHYRRQAGPGARLVNSLLHYACVGRRRGLSPHPWFDASYYRAHNHDVVAAGADMLLHYLNDGGREGRSPCAAFDGSYYLRANPDVAASGMNPLLHYLRYGRAEGRRTNPLAPAVDVSTAGIPHAVAPSIPTEEEWSALDAKGESVESVVDVIIPVYRGRAETLHCVASVLQSRCDTPFTLVVIDDCSPDQELAEDLGRLAAKGLFVLLRNERNLGFVHTVNRGMSRSKARDVVILNSDTEVHGNWLDRLRKVSIRDHGIATITPLSNSATICSYPVTLHDNPFQLEVSATQLDDITARSNIDVVVPTPSGIGFCMYIARAALEAVGLFDAETFGAGYGEENDFCQRAIKSGMTNVIAAEVFVWHWGSVSFAGSKSERVAKAMKIIGQKYPSYHRDVAEFIARDPLREARRRLDWGRLLRQRGTRNILMVCHRRGGGTERQLQAEAIRHRYAGAAIYLIRPAEESPGRVELSCLDVPLTPNLGTFALSDGRLAEVLAELGITDVLVHSVIDFDFDAPGKIADLARRIGAVVGVRVHDYEPICPRITLTRPNGKYCGEPDASECARCLKSSGAEVPVADIGSWRNRHERLFRSASEIVVPDSDVAKRIDRYYPSSRIKVVPHETGSQWPVENEPRLMAMDPLRIVVIGAINRPKGYEVLRACASDARRRGLRLKFILMGHSLDDIALEEAGVDITGRYQDDGALDMLRNLKPHAVWIPSTWPETYCFTLSIALAGGITIFAFDLGAIANRLRKLERDEYLMPLAICDDPGAVNERFVQFRARCMRQVLPSIMKSRGTPKPASDIAESAPPAG